MADVPSAHQPGSVNAAGRGLVAWETINSARFLERRSRADGAAAHPLIDRFARELCEACWRRGWPMYAVEFVRSKERQNYLEGIGRSKARFGSSPHNFGLAVDIVHYGRGWGLTEQEWALVGLLGKEVGRRLNVHVDWGGDWKFYDPAHWQLSDWKKRRGERYPRDRVARAEYWKDVRNRARRK